MAQRRVTSRSHRTTAERRRFSAGIIEALTNAPILGVRAGSEHRFTGVWVVVVEGRVFARSWSDSPTGWFRAFCAQPVGSIRFGDNEVRVRASGVRSVRFREAVSAAYGLKYKTKASEKWVRGFSEPERSANTVEFTPV